MVKIGGRRLDPAEVERVLRLLPAVHDAFVEPHRERADTLAAAVATRRPAAEIRAGLQERLAAWKIPRKLLTLPEFPLTARGKVDAFRLRALLHGD
jgi:acyl-CoA synthetase (AMP-forming)/AMP-acid ligase II